MKPSTFGFGTLLYCVRMRFAPGMTLYGPAAYLRCSIPDELEAAASDGSRASMATASTIAPRTLFLNSASSCPALSAFRLRYIFKQVALQNVARGANVDSRSHPWHG